MNMAQAVSIMWDLVKTNRFKGPAKSAALLSMDKVLGLNLERYLANPVVIPEEVKAMALDREKLRKERRFHLADQLRHRIEKMGYEVLDRKDSEPVIRKID
jgi:cysteinyl-tRNA synthetase